MPSRKLRILIVDDNQGVQMLLRVLLNTEHCVAINASNGDEAKAILMAQPWIDLIILDLKMPRSDGASLLVWRKTNPTVSQIPIIILSGDASIESIADQFDIEFFLEKGGHPSRLVEMVQTIMQRRGYSFPATA